MIEKLTAWGTSQEAVRAMVLTSSRAVPDNPTVDRYSDYDVILALRDVRPFHESREWLAAFGTVLAMYRDPMHELLLPSPQGPSQRDGATTGRGNPSLAGRSSRAVHLSDCH